MRLAYLDEGESQTAPTIMLHGEPTWSYLWGKVIEPLLVAGHRCVAPDLPGIRRSDKLLEEAWYSYDNHTVAITSLFADLDLWDVTLVVHDWSDPIGLRVVTTENAPSA
jgi:haloalkane dehalogenase